jgi:hypothetical protein
MKEETAATLSGTEDVATQRNARREGAALAPMLKINYRALESQQVATVRLDGLRCQLCMDFLLALAAFPPPLAPAGEAAVGQGKSKPPEPEAVKANAQAAVPTQEASSGQLRVHLDLVDACITVYAQPRTPSSRALRLTFDTRFDPFLFFLPQRSCRATGWSVGLLEVVGGGETEGRRDSFRSLGLGVLVRAVFSIYYTTSAAQMNAALDVMGLRLASLKQSCGVSIFTTVLQPAHLSIGFSQTTGEERMLINLRSKHIELDVSYRDLEIVSDVMAALAPAAPPVEETFGEDPVIALAGAALEDSHWYLRNTEEAEALSQLSLSSSGNARVQGGRWTPSAVAAQAVRPAGSILAKPLSTVVGAERTAPATAAPLAFRLSPSSFAFLPALLVVHTDFTPRVTVCCRVPWRIGWAGTRRR